MAGIYFRCRPAQFAAALLAAFGVLTAGGCSSKAKKAVIDGKVTYKGGAVAWGSVRFFDADGTLWSSALLNPDGTFTATDVPPGEVQVAVKELPPLARPKQEGDSGDKGVPAGKSVRIPPKYQDPKTSGLHYTIGPGTNHLEIELQ